MIKNNIFLFILVIILTSCMSERKGGDPYTYFEDNEIPVAQAIHRSDAKELERILKENHININKPGKAGFTFLQYAIQFRDYKMIEILLENGADPNIISHTTLRLDGYIAEPPIDRLPLITVCDAKYDIKYMKLLIKYNANVNDNRIGIALAAVLYGYQKNKLNYLMKHGADVNIQGKKAGLTPIIRAARLSNFEAVEYFLDHGAEPLIVGYNGGDSLEYWIQNYIESTEGHPDTRKNIRKLIRRLESLGLKFDFSKAKFKMKD